MCASVCEKESASFHASVQPPPLAPSQDEYHRIAETVDKGVFVITVEIVHPLLRQWMGLKPGQVR